MYLPKFFLQNLHLVVRHSRSYFILSELQNLGSTFSNQFGGFRISWDPRVQKSFTSCGTDKHIGTVELIYLEITFEASNKHTIYTNSSS